MRKTLLAAALISSAFSFQSEAQVVSTFDTLQLSGTDTFYVNYNMPGQDVGFWDGAAYFPSVFDTSSFGPYWSGGFSYSNMTDTLTPGYMNDKSAITGVGYNGSANYAVYFQGYTSTDIQLYHAGADHYTAPGFYVTNATYAYLSMRDGDFVAKKFGGPTGTDPDWFKLTVYGYVNGNATDSVEHYLADFRSTDSTLDYIQKNWQWVDLTSLNMVDSIRFMLTSSDNGQFGMNTPGYVCIDDFTVIPEALSVNSVDKNAPVKVYPNPATDVLFINAEQAMIVSVYDAAGKLVLQDNMAKAKHEINTGAFAPGTYFLHLKGDSKTTSLRFIKQ